MYKGEYVIGSQTMYTPTDALKKTEKAGVPIPFTTQQKLVP